MDINVISANSTFIFITVGMIVIIYLILYLKRIGDGIRRETNRMGEGLRNLQSKFPVDLQAMREEELIKKVEEGDVDAERVLMMRFNYNEVEIQAIKANSKGR